MTGDAAVLAALITVAAFMGGALGRQRSVRVRIGHGLLWATVIGGAQLARVLMAGSVDPSLGSALLTLSVVALIVLWLRAVLREVSQAS
jgi:hypothetical protein